MKDTASGRALRESRSRPASVDHIKATGCHYTPEGLAAFLARRALAACASAGPLSVLDPSCGDGNLLVAVAEEAGAARAGQISLVGLEQDALAVASAQIRLSRLRHVKSDVRHGDFLELAPHATDHQSELFASPRLLPHDFDLIIANPPYVRTQVLGAEEAQRLSVARGLSGRVDL